MGGMGAPAGERRLSAGQRGEKRKKEGKKETAWRPASSLVLPSFTYRANCGVTEADELSPGAEFFTKGLIVGAIRGHYGRGLSVCLSLILFLGVFSRPTQAFRKGRGSLRSGSSLASVLLLLFLPGLR